jgi:hypothetical protein
MAIVVHGTQYQVARFGKLIRESLGPVLGNLLELPEAADSEMTFSETPSSIPQGAEFPHFRFYQFLEPIVSDGTTRVDLQLAENSHTHYAGSGRGAHCRVDLTDLEMIMAGPGSTARIGALVRILSERHYMVTRNFHPWPGMEADEWREVVYGPAHDHAAGTVIRVLGQLQGEMSERYSELRGNYDSMMPIGTSAVVDPVHESVALEPPLWHQTRTFRMIDHHQPPGVAYRNYTVTHVPDGPYGVERHDEVPVGVKQRRPMGERLHDQVF